MGRTWRLWRSARGRSAQGARAWRVGDGSPSVPCMGAMEMVKLLPRLYFLRFPVGHVYLWLDDDGLTLVDCGVAGSGKQIAAATVVERMGRDRCSGRVKQ